MYSPCDQQGSHTLIMAPIVQKQNNSQKNKGVKTQKKSRKSNPEAKQPSSVSVSAPVASSIVRQQPNPTFEHSKDGRCKVSFREYITDISGSVDFAVTEFSVNPGLPGTFPWLFPWGSRFESYVFEELEAMFETTSPTTASGTVIIAPDYDISDNAPVNKTQAMNYQDRARSAPWANCRMVASRKNLKKRSSYFCRIGNVPQSDRQLYDTCKIYVCTQGQANSNIIGELYIKYTVIFSTPSLDDPSQGISIGSVFAGASNANPFADPTDQEDLANNLLPATKESSGTTSSVTTWTFTQPWEGYVHLNLTGTGISLLDTVGSTAANIDGVLFIVNAAATGLSYGFFLDVDPGQTLVVNITNTTLTSVRGVFAQLAYQN